MTGMVDWAAARARMVIAFILLSLAAGGYAYFNLPKEGERIRNLVDPAECDVVLFTSSSTVQNLVDVLGEDATGRLNALDLFSIGPVTTQTAERRGLAVAATAPEQTIESLVATVRAYYALPGDADA